jgi:6-phosphogluconolactonase (cycloisomerase 2 family)
MAMRLRRWAWVLLAPPLAAVFLTGCANFWQAPSTTSTTTTTTTATSGFFYVLNQGTKQIAAYSIISGTLTAVSGSPYTLAATPTALAVAPNGSFLYVATAAGIYLYTINSSGQLTLANGSNVVSQDLAASMQVDFTDSWLIEAGPNSTDLFAIPINPSTGALTGTTEQHVQLPAATVFQIAISPDNTHVFVALGSAGTEDIVFAAGITDPFSSSANVAVKNSAGAAVSIAVDPSNRLVYIGETAAVSGSNSGAVRVLNYSTLVEITGSPYASGGLAPYSILPASTGDFIYVANRTVSGSSTGNISGFAVTSTGTVFSLTAISSTVAAGITPVGLAEDSTSNFVLVVNSGGSPDLAAYVFDTTTAGKLDSVISASTGTDPVVAGAIAAAP